MPHDLKTVITALKSPFQLSEVKCLLHQLLQGLSAMHACHVAHRDLKTSNLLLSHKGILKVADLGSARTVGALNAQYTSPVVTLWYRPPEVLFGTKEHTFAIDVWSGGCIFAELVLGRPLFTAESELPLISSIFSHLGLPTSETWPTFTKLPGAKMWNLSTKKPVTPTLRSLFPRSSVTGSGYLTDKG